ncbi:MAG: glycosyltransferase family 9 protein, partial [Desulfobacteraceae bacterium]|nr:glycosyltransferase family 9 protein [Desulfobacteraceae bacterium]
MKILLVQLSFLGDTILSTPVIAGLKKLYPESKISVLTTPISSSLVENDPFVEEVIVYDKRKKDKGIFNLYKKACQIKAKSFDKVYSIHRSHRTSTLLFLSCIPERIGFKDAKLSFLYTEQRNKKFDGHAAIRNLSLLFNDASEENFDNNLRLFEPELQNISNNVQKIPKNYIVMAPGSAWKTKQWHWQGYLNVAEYYIKQGINIILIGGKEDMAICNKINEKTDVI